ncbi:MAG: hypothetical protein P8Y25_15065 [Chromatiaceae bacterium]
MARIDQLLASYRRHVSLTPRGNLPLSQRVWFVVYPPEDERRLANRIPEFEMATRDEGLDWQRLDLNGAFADWMDTFDPEERRDCLAEPEIVESYADPGFIDYLGDRIRAALESAPSAEAVRTVFAVSGLMDLYDFVHVSAVLSTLDDRLPGIVLLFFPGEREGNTYRFLGARTGWNYLATPILAEA